MELAACLDHDKYFAKYSRNHGNCGFFILSNCVNREVRRREVELERGRDIKKERDREIKKERDSEIRKERDRAIKKER